MIASLLILTIGLVLLVAGAELLVRGASRIAGAIGISPLVIGLTVVAFGTSAPELAVSVGAALQGQSDIALGNVVGSNVFNVLFILGLAATIAPLVVAGQLVRSEVPIMIGVSVLALLMALDGTIGRMDGAVLALGLVAYIVLQIRVARREPPAVQHEFARTLDDEPAPPPPAAGPTGAALLGQGLFIIAGLALLVVGARALVGAATDVARALGASELVIGLTIVAAGTSLPEVATSVLATIRGQREIAVGNVVGSNIFNLLGILGATAIIRPVGVATGALWFDLPVMLAVALVCLPIFFTGGRIARWEGVLLLGYYAAYTSYLVLDAAVHDALPAFRQMLVFIVPLTVLAIVTSAMTAVVRDRRSARTRDPAEPAMTLSNARARAGADHA